MFDLFNENLHSPNLSELPMQFFFLISCVFMTCMHLEDYAKKKRRKEKKKRGGGKEEK